MDGLKLKDQVAIVTGGGGGLGEGICLCLAREGANVVVSDVDLGRAQGVAAKVSDTGRKALAVQTDVRSAEQCEALVKTAIAEMGGLDILVCAAGVGGFAVKRDLTLPPLLEHIPEEEWDLLIDVNLKGVFLCNRAVAPYFKGQRRGKIINISSIAGRHGVDWIPHYSASKAGVIVLTQAVTQQLAPYGVNANTICPGFIWTSMWVTGAEALAQGHETFKGMRPDEIFDAVVTRSASKRAQTPEGIGKAVVFLASSDSEEINGQAINVDGGAEFN
jgi:meso-butanediol dehydrogenase / (S,S)-butanediol dehydrogenase / diacetyl reductase